MTADERTKLIERLKKDNCCTHERGHLFNCHKQCQWCHQMQTDIDAADAANELARLSTIVGPLERLLEARGRVTIHHMWHPTGAVSIRLGHIGKELFSGPDLASALSAADEAGREKT